MTRAKPSNRPTVYILAVPMSSFPFAAYHIWRFPPPLSGPVARKSTSAVHNECNKGFSAHAAPLWFPGAGGVRTILFDRISGGSGFPTRWKFGTARRLGDILQMVSK